MLELRTTGTLGINFCGCLKKKVLHELLLPLSVRETGTLGFCTHLCGTNHEAVSMSLPEKKTELKCFNEENITATVDPLRTFLLGGTTSTEEM